MWLPSCPPPPRGPRMGPTITQQMTAQSPSRPKPNHPTRASDPPMAPCRSVPNPAGPPPCTAGPAQVPSLACPTEESGRPLPGHQGAPRQGSSPRLHHLIPSPGGSNSVSPRGQLQVQRQSERGPSPAPAPQRTEPGPREEVCRPGSPTRRQGTRALRVPQAPPSPAVLNGHCGFRRSCPPKGTYPHSATAPLG